MQCPENQHMKKVFSEGQGERLYQMLLVAHVFQDSVFYGIYLNVYTISRLSDFSFCPSGQRSAIVILTFE